MELHWGCSSKLYRIGLLGDLFVGGLKAIAPILVLPLLPMPFPNTKGTKHQYEKTVIFLYLLGTFAAALVAVLASFLLPVQITLTSANTEVAALTVSVKSSATSFSNWWTIP